LVEAPVIAESREGTVVATCGTRLWLRVL